MKKSCARQFLLLSSAFFAVSALALSGCKNSTTNAAIVTDRTVAAPPTFDIYQTRTSPLLANPLNDPVWLNAGWHTFVAPINSVRTTPAARAALLYDATTLYVAFVSEKSTQAVSRDMVSVYLDSTGTGDGKELAQISVDSAGTATCTWIRSSATPKRHDDGSPDLSFPVQKIPDRQMPGLQANLGQATINGVEEWTAVVAIPLKKLPEPLRTVGAAGAHWKLNLLRTMVTPSEVAGSPGDLIQSNLSPVHINAQPVSPYRLADVHLSAQQVSLMSADNPAAAAN